MQKQRPRRPLSSRYVQIMRTFAENLKSAREASFRSAQQFAEVLGMEPHAYRKYERGQSEPNFDTFLRICELLGITPNDLLPLPKRRKAESRSAKQLLDVQP